MQLTETVKTILGAYEGVNVGSNLSRILMQGKLGGTGRLLILPVDQGFEHGPARSFTINPAAYDPAYFIDLALSAGLSAYAAPLGALQVAGYQVADKLPLILKMNNGNALTPSGRDQAVTASVQQARDLGCAAIGFTIYPGSEAALAQFEELQQLAEEAHAHGLAVVVWSYPRGPNLKTEDETALDVVAYGAHMAALLGADIVKVKLPSARIALPESQAVYPNKETTLAERVAHIVQCCFAGKRLVVFSGGAAKDNAVLLEEAQAIRTGGGNGSIMGRNAFQRPRDEALALLDEMINIYQSL